MALAEIPAALVESCRMGDRAATERLLRLVSPDLYRIVFSMLRDHDDTDEVVQETLIRMFRHIGKLKETGKFASWAMRIAVNQVQTWRLRKGRRPMAELDDLRELEDGVVVLGGGSSRSPREELIQRELRQEIGQAMAALPNRQQTAVVLFEVEGCSIREIAEAMGCSEGAVKFNLHEARKKLQRRLAHLFKGWRRNAAESELAASE